MPTPVSCMINRGSTGRMMPKPIESISTRMKMNSRAPPPALRTLTGPSWGARYLIRCDAYRTAALIALPRLSVASRCLSAEEHHCRRGRDQRDLQQPHHVLRERVERGPLEEQPLHEAQHVCRRIDVRDELQPPRHVLHGRRKARQQREWQQ